MVLEMKRALEELKSGDVQGYKKIFDATSEETYCRSFLMIQKEARAVEFMKSFYVELFGQLDEADGQKDLEGWFWNKFYQYVRKQYHLLLEDQKKEAPAVGKVKTLAEIPVSLPLLHRIMAVMAFKDDFKAVQISSLYGLEEAKICAELEKLDKILPSLTKGQPDSVRNYLGNWNLLLLGASKQLSSITNEEWSGSLFTDICTEAGIQIQPKAEDFEYFVADIEIPAKKEEVKKPSKPLIPVPVEEEDDEEDDEYDEEDDDEEYDEDYDDEDDEDDDEDSDRYDWDLEDDSRKFVILGILLAVLIVVVIGFGAWKLLGNKDKGAEPNQTEEEMANEGDAELIIRGDAPNLDEEPVEEEPVEEEPVEEEPVEEPQTVYMVVNCGGGSVNVRSEGSTNGSVVTKVEDGKKVEVIGDPGAEWINVRCEDGSEGFIRADMLKSAE